MCKKYKGHWHYTKPFIQHCIQWDLSQRIFLNTLIIRLFRVSRMFVRKMTQSIITKLPANNTYLKFAHRALLNFGHIYWVSNNFSQRGWCFFVWFLKPRNCNNIRQEILHVLVHFSFNFGSGTMCS